MKIIALCGRKQSGKDSIGDWIVLNRERLGCHTARKFGFAGPLKRMCSELFGVDPKLYETDEGKNSFTKVRWEDLPHYDSLMGWALKIMDGPLTVRELLQHFGTDVVRRMNPNAWVEAAMLEVWRSDVDLAVLTDTRFPNEVEAVRKVGGKAVRLTRNEDKPAEHETESALDPARFPCERFDAVIYNSACGVEEQELMMRDLVCSWGWWNEK